mmetsp:Transcript_4045/g.6257  ORF Transcript_4045/g.6257 Transcript_4045/m.6257 type:complete len:238 (-) Transcript_4045:894-1607(-)
MTVSIALPLFLSGLKCFGIHTLRHWEKQHSNTPTLTGLYLQARSAFRAASRSAHPETRDRWASVTLANGRPIPGLASGTNRNSPSELEVAEVRSGHGRSSSNCRYALANTRFSSTCLTLLTVSAPETSFSAMVSISLKISDGPNRGARGYMRRNWVSSAHKTTKKSIECRCAGLNLRHSGPRGLWHLFCGWYVLRARYMTSPSQRRPAAVRWVPSTHSHVQAPVPVSGSNGKEWTGT